ncbi:Hypothetical predicted protein [Cloeon dipterum]|uniref:Uncharacterized protein n=1 Tax=Cloeon dipterum TaxID=197152 RepID=A0A8S1C1V5_9INSE|nr:Hypothetical predicted protein [Cloeon dipterum]
MTVEKTKLRKQSAEANIKPNKAGSPWESYLGNKCWTSLRRLIFDDLPFKQVPAEAKFKYSLSVEGQVFVKENLLNTTNDRVYTEVENIFKYFQRNLELKLDVANTTGEKSAIAKVSNQEIKLFATNLRNLGELVPDLKKLQLLKNQDFHNMSFLVRKAEFFHGVIEKNTQSVVAEIKLVLKPYLKKALDAANFYSFLAELEVELDTYWPQYNRADLSTPLTQTNFRKIILNAEKHNLKISDKDSLYAVVPTKEMIDDLNRILSKHLDYKIYFKPNEYDLVIEGQHILISEIKNKMNASSRNQLKNIYIYGHKKIFVDESFTVQNANLSFASPVIEAVIKVPGIVPVIKTIGLDSTEVMPQAPRCKTPGLFGQRGQPGKAGGKAGNVLIAALEIKSPANMAIESKGGRGGPGQRGGDGCDGQTSPIPDYSPAARFGEFHDVYNHYSSRGYTVTVTNERAVQLSNYRQNIYPTQGGTGGEGGPGGNPGSVLIRTKETIDGLINQILSFGDSGEGGTGGTGGRGMARCSEAHLFCERHEEKKRRSGFNWARYNCQWFKKECDIIVTHTCSKGEKGGRSSLASNRPLPPQETVDTSPLKAEVAALASVVNSPQLKQLDTFIKSVL